MTVIVKIKPDDIVYIPSNLVKHGEEVEFQLDGVPSAQVVFADGTCFTTTGPYTLDNANPLANVSDQFVTMTCPKRLYPFDVTIPAPSLAGSGSFIGSNAETKKGGLDVTTDPPEDPRKK